MTIAARSLQFLVIAAFFGAAGARADSVNGSSQDGYGRLAFSLTSGAHLSATTTGGVLAIAFDQKTGLDPAAIASAMPRFIASGHGDADGKTLRFSLSQPVRLHVSQAGTRAVVDLAEPNFTGAMPDLVLPPPPARKPIDIASLPEVKLRAGAYANFTRLVFDWPKNVPYTVFPGAGKMTVRFAALARPDLSVIARFPPPWVKNAGWHLDGNAIVVEFETDADSGYHDFRDGTHVVIDILAPKTDAAAYTPPGTAKPPVTLIKTGTPIKPGTLIASGVTSAQARAVAQTAEQLNPKPVAKPADAKTQTVAGNSKLATVPAAEAPAPAAAPAPAPSAPTASSSTRSGPTATPPTVPVDAPPVVTAGGERTRDGAILTFKGAGGSASAVFIRGLTAWIVVENAPGFDAKALETSLNGFAAGLEASSSNGLSILRITLKAPAQIAARSRGPSLEIVIAPHLPDSPVPIDFARNQFDSGGASLSTLLPGADKSFVLLDPASGDLLTIVPAAPGRAMPRERNYADFAALPTASGLVLAPYTDDLAVSVADARVTITRPGGLALTAAQMPAAQSPAALLYYSGESPSYLDFESWAQLRGGNFLATERNLTQAVARLRPAEAGPAWQALARFYLGNGFAAEALGALNVLQAHDPGLAVNAQLITMRAAADYLMGRYRDAHNDLAGPQFDADRHAALWRGLTDAALENWKDAHAHLEQAYPILSRYDADWQARAHLADAEAGLGMGRLDLADAALSRMPKTLSPRFALEAELANARIAAESHYSAAAPMFAALENSGQEDLAAKAIFYDTVAALSAGAIDAKQAIERLEKLRFRWRGDSLEMKTLRKLAGLYFASGQWRDGLRSLRLAQENFAGEASRSALDDMRAAFVNLYLKGAADKMKPVDALGLFYDNIDLTPIGPDGDEMIRRMADRLVAIDLLGPAASLLSYQVNKRLDGIAKAQVSTRLATVYLMDHKPELAVKTIRDSQVTGLPDSDLHDRLLLEARAFAALKQWDNALDLIAVDNSPDTRRLRADIYWESGNWEIAGQKGEELLDTSWSDAAPLSEFQRSEVLRAAIAYSLASDEASLDRIRDRFTPKMKATPDANLFAVLAADIDAHGMAFRNAAAQIAQIDTLENFMKDFAKRHDTVATN